MSRRHLHPLRRKSRGKASGRRVRRKGAGRPRHPFPLRGALLIGAVGAAIAVIILAGLPALKNGSAFRSATQRHENFRARSQLPILPPSTTDSRHAPRSRNMRGMVALVIDDLGMDRHRTAEAIALPSVVTLAFLPYAPAVAEQVANARARGHEILLHLPMEPVGHADPGPMALTAALDRRDFLARLSWNLTRFDGYVGVNNHMGSRLTADRRAMRWLMRDLKARGLLFLDSRTTARTVAAEVAAEEGVPYAVRRVFLDHERGNGALKSAYARIRRLAQREPVVAIGHPHRRTLAHIRRWLRHAARDGLVYVPISMVVHGPDARLARATDDPAGGG